MFDIRDHGGNYGGSNKRDFYKLEMDNLPIKDVRVNAPDQVIISPMDETYLLLYQGNYPNSFRYNVYNSETKTIISSSDWINWGVSPGITSADAINNGESGFFIKRDGAYHLISHRSGGKNYLMYIKIDAATMAIEVRSKIMDLAFVGSSSYDILTSYREEYNQVLFFSNSSNRLTAMDMEVFLSKDSFIASDFSWAIANIGFRPKSANCGDTLVSSDGTKFLTIDKQGIQSTIINSSISAVPILQFDKKSVCYYKEISDPDYGLSRVILTCVSTVTGAVIWTNTIELDRHVNTFIITPQFNRVGYRPLDGYFVFNTGYEFFMIDSFSGGVSKEPILKKLIQNLPYYNPTPKLQSIKINRNTLSGRIFGVQFVIPEKV